MEIIRKPELRRMIYEKLRTEYRREYSVEAIYYITQCLFLCIQDVLKNGDSLKLYDCFTLEPMLIGGRKYNCLGEYQGVSPMHFVPRFVPYKKLKDACLSIPVAEEELQKKENQKSRKKSKNRKKKEEKGQ